MQLNNSIFSVVARLKAKGFFPSITKYLNWCGSDLIEDEVEDEDSDLEVANFAHIVVYERFWTLFYVFLRFLGHNKFSCIRGQQPKPTKPFKPPKPPSNKQYSRMGGIKIKDVGGSTSKTGGGSVGKGGGSVGRGGGGSVGRGGGSVGRGGGGSVGRGGGSTSKRGGVSGLGRGGRSTSKRGGGSGVGRGGGSVGRGGACNSKRGGRSITSKGSGSVGRGGSNSMDTEEEQFRKDQEAEREVIEEVMAAREKERLDNEQYARTYCDWEDLQWEGDGFEEPNPNLRLATMSDLIAADEAHDEHFNNMPSLTNDVSLDVSHTVE
ncbi:hypothetical protein Tco_1011707, partial [Tanacetum coccineum]